MVCPRRKRGWFPDCFKIIAEALRVLAGFARSIRPMDKNGDFIEGSVGDPGRFAPIIFEAVLSRFIKNDIDQEIKECSLKLSVK